MAAQVTLTGISNSAIYQLALTMPVGQQKQRYVQEVLNALGSNPIFEIRVGTTPIYRTTVPTSIPAASAGIALPGTLTEPPSLNTTGSLSGDTAVIALRNATNAAIELSVPVKFGGDPASFLLASKGTLNGTDLVRLSSVLLRPPSNLDVPGTPSGQGPDWLQTALTDMRKDPATGSFSYMNSYAVNDHKPLFRTQRSYSSQYDRANLVMGRYPNTLAFTNTNPDYQTELSYLSASDPRRTYDNWDRIIPWSQIYLSEEQQTSTRHAQGFVGNTMVLMWDMQLWVKRTSGLWTRLQEGNPAGGEAWRPTFQEGPSSANFIRILNWNGTGLTAFRPDPAAGLDSTGSYWVNHPYGALIDWSTANVAEMLTSWKMSLVMSNVNGVDDRDFSRYLAAVGFDYYAPASTGGSGTFLLGGGTSRHKYVRAKYPDFQYHVMHTASWDSLAASHPDVNS